MLHSVHGRWRIALHLLVLVAVLGIGFAGARSGPGADPAGTPSIAAHSADASGGWRPKHLLLCAATAVAVGATCGVAPPAGPALAIAMLPLLISACS